MILKNWLPVGGATVSESELSPVSLMAKDLVSVTVLLESLILLKLK